MDFELTEEQKNIKMAAREFAEKEFKPKIGREYDQKYEWPYELYKKAGKQGFIGVHFPEEYGGQGLGVLEMALIWEEFFRVDSTLAHILWGQEGADIVVNFGSEEQKQKYIPGICKGELISTLAITEPYHGSDVGVAGLDTKATKDGNCWVINGTKTFISMGNIADWIIVGCQTDPNAKPLYRGVSAIIVEKGMPGFEARVLHPKMGQRSVPTTELSFNNVRVPLSNLVGEENKGFYYIMDYIDIERIQIAALCVGVAQGAFERALKYSTQRVQFGKPIASYQLIQSKIADMATKIEAARLLLYKACWIYDHKKDDRSLVRRACAMAKNVAVKTALEVVDEAIQIHGGYGFVDSDLERYYRDLRLYRIGGGTEEILKIGIAREFYREIGFEV
jgi:acyl-CoA dehydrogenase